ncbi:hypothetical protein ACLM5J_19640 [Nocardioides sp. Bht2]|uniref:hypothetical protein n=1 Tax=Nocardioides sp. Bht2 TaxID=3392297 RepID=UPI0039B5F236
MPRVVVFDPPLPMSVSVASSVFGSEITVALIAQFREPGTRKTAQEALGLRHAVAANHVRNLVSAGVLVVVSEQSGPHAAVYVTDAKRVDELLGALRSYSLSGTSDG